MEVEDADPPWSARERTLIIKMQSYLQKSQELQVGLRELVCVTCSDLEMKIPVSVPSKKTRGTWKKTRGTWKDSAVSCCSIRVEAKKWFDAARDCEAAVKEKPGGKDVEEEVNM